MAQVTTIKVAEGSSNIVIRVNLLSDGSGELVNVPILAPLDLSPSRPNNRPAFNIRQAWYAMVWFDFTLSAGTLFPATLWTFARDCDSHIDFRSFGGLVDQNVYITPPPDDNGILTITTNGFGQLGSQGTLVLDIQKTNEPR